MDLSHAQRTEAARAAFQQDPAPSRDAALIANVLKAHTVDGMDRWLALGRVCPYWATQRREREAWLREIRRQTGEVEAPE